MPDRQQQAQRHARQPAIAAHHGGPRQCRRGFHAYDAASGERPLGQRGAQLTADAGACAIRSTAWPAEFNEGLLKILAS